ncbi:two-component system, response regulator YesN [Thalassobacillus cyri]|uniref:Two-component system, response regulator YesN n=1 Tax=Thalassobacillus cyri TaxID=571932 RepID=A0A1H4ACA1_9BACI|nr:response regulator [Thalassobacillus cyri]SEA33516.1 two-component system, response regulator YesN [Thalassobacillus cyri]
MGRLKVLIADDEFIIRDGILSSINWEQYEMEVVGEAEDGEEAVELALELQIDILLVDLNMPIMNGITVMKILKEQLPKCKMVVISGYDEFRYAQEAIRLQVADYLLKPVNPEKLSNLIHEIKQQIDTEVNQETYLKQAENQIKKNHAQLKQRFFQDWIEGHLANEEIKKQLQFLNLPVRVPMQYIIIKCPKFHHNQTLMQENDRQVYLFAVENIIGELLESKRAAVFRDRSDLLNVCLWEQVTSEEVVQIEEAIKEYLNITVFWHLETIIDEDLSTLYEVYDQCKTQIHKKTRLSPIVKQAKAYVQQHYQDSSLTLERVAEELHVTTVYLSRLMKQELGISYIGLLTQLRINKATDLLKTTDMPIRNIAEEVGYESQHYFSTAFKKVVGISPKQLKKLTT